MRDRNRSAKCLQLTWSLNWIIGSPSWSKVCLLNRYILFQISHLEKSLEPFGKHSPQLPVASCQAHYFVQMLRWPLSTPFLFRTSGKGTDNITKFHMCSHWVWQPCEVMPFCKHIDDTRKSDSFNQVNELKSFGRKFQWNQGEKVWQKRNHRETWDNTCYLKIIAEDLGKHL